MNIKKYQAETEEEAILQARDDLGKDAIVMNIKKIKPKGIYKLFKKTVVEVTAAVDDEKIYSHTGVRQPRKMQDNLYANSDSMKKEGIYPEEEKSAIEEKLDSLQNMLKQQMQSNMDINPPKTSKNVRTEEVVKKEGEDVEKTEDVVKNDKKTQCLNLIKEKMKDNDVTSEYVEQILGEVDKTIKADASVDNILTTIYQKIVLKLGQTKLIENNPDNVKYVFFMGPTGVGKTTSIAKIASEFKLVKKKNICLVTSDTYRIAAVEQLKTYANILNVPLEVVYNASELKEIKERLDEFDLVLIDTAGRSHKNKAQGDDLRELVDAIPKDERCEYLVLSVTTKYNDLKQIAKAYSDYEDYRLIFTKLDETSTLGNILNIKLLTNASLSYSSWGQDVPNDFGRIDTQSIAKQLLGGSN
ncbi:MAG: flagellar biosynthesis protein FlhF [Lachnospiraceae bacterium]|nr:flagellar biosynthesis protein FlhF [Lachnospiraceae bacterium]